MNNLKNWGHQMKKLACTLLLLSSALVQAGFDEGLVAANKGDHQTAFKEWKPLAEQGDAVAQFNLGIMYYNGQGVAQNYTQAIFWYKKAAEKGFAVAQSNLGFMYAMGKGIPQNYKIAYILFNLAASNGLNDTENRDKVLTKLSPATIEDAQRITLQLYNSKNFAADLRKLLSSQN